MNRREFLRASAPLALTPALFARQGGAPQIMEPTPPPLPPAGADGWVSLINGRDLTGWYTMLQRSGKGVAETKGLVVMEEQMLHIMGNNEGDFPAEGGYLATSQEFANVHIRVEYKWGMKRHAPRFTPKRDNGVLYGLVGTDRVWPTCVECQIEEGDVGDFFLLGGVRGIQGNHNAGLFGEGINPLTGWPARGAGPGRAGGGAAGAPGAGAAAGGAGRAGGAQAPAGAGGAAGAGGGAAAAPGAGAGAGGGGRAAATPPTPTSGRFIKDGDFELLDQWNTVEVIWQGDRAEHIVNGRTVNVATSLQQPDPQNAGQFIPLTRGKIAIEIEYAEIWYRRIEVKALG
jgi:hypothetical protein